MLTQGSGSEEGLSHQSGHACETALSASSLQRHFEIGFSVGMIFCLIGNSALATFYFPVCWYRCSSHVLMLQPSFCAKPTMDPWQELPPSCSLPSISHLSGTGWAIRSSSSCALIPGGKHPLRAAPSPWDAQAQRQLQPTWSRAGINSLQEERQEKLHDMALWPELQYSGSACFCNKLCFSQHQSYTGGDPKFPVFLIW